MFGFFKRQPVNEQPAFTPSRRPKSPAQLRRETDEYILKVQNESRVLCENYRNMTAAKSNPYRKAVSSAIAFFFVGKLFK